MVQPLLLVGLGPVDATGVRGGEQHALQPGGAAAAAAEDHEQPAVPHLPVGHRRDRTGPEVVFDACVELFGAERCMLESNFPVDGPAGSYRRFWNAFKRLAAGASVSEKTALFSGTANRVYRLGL